jgi:predicted CXXCH cytochrome family protein
VDWKGDLTCSTCHLVHGIGRGLLRGNKRGKELCLACHDAAFFTNMKDEGSSIVQSGHLDAGITLSEAELDPFSLQCLYCHSPKFDVPEVDVDRVGILRHASGRNNHPVGRRYRESARFGGYHLEQSLSERVILPDGKISCVSCHQAYSQNHGKLVMPNGGSRLCLECHDL